MRERLEASVYGRVQMVMFRDFVTRKARGLQLTGEVQNCTDGTVYVVAEGPRDRLDRLLAKIHRGPLLAHVTSVEARWLPASGTFSRFTLLYEWKEVSN